MSRLTDTIQDPGLAAERLALYESALLEIATLYAANLNAVQLRAFHIVPMTLAEQALIEAGRVSLIQERLKRIEDETAKSIVDIGKGRKRKAKKT